MPNAQSRRYDYVLVGGGLSSALIALALFERKPNARVALVEQGESLGGNHLWCFHAGDVADAASFVDPLVVRRWPRYEVRFPRLQRTLEEPYAAVSSERLDQVVQLAFAGRGRLGSHLWLSRRATHVTGTRVELETGETLEAELVIEARGPEALEPAAAGYQKFIGLELELAAPSPLTHPVLMDALLPQRDGFRFMYALPLDERRVLLEDTYFSDDRALDAARLEREIALYAAENRLQVLRVIRREAGVLPLPLAMPTLRAAAPSEPLVAGYQGGWFHPVTGYSFPLAARLASAVAGSSPVELRQQVWPALARKHRAQARFFVLLNRMMFGAFAPHDRVGAIERFYRLPPEAVRRFYAASTTRGDRLRIVCGRPPRGFSLSRAIGLTSNRPAEAS